MIPKTLFSTGDRAHHLNVKLISGINIILLEQTISWKGKRFHPDFSEPEFRAHPVTVFPCSDCAMAEQSENIINIDAIANTEGQDISRTDDIAEDAEQEQATQRPVISENIAHSADEDDADDVSTAEILRNGGSAHGAEARELRVSSTKLNQETPQVEPEATDANIDNLPANMEGQETEEEPPVNTADEESVHEYVESNSVEIDDQLGNVASADQEAPDPMNPINKESEITLEEPEIGAESGIPPEQVISDAPTESHEQEVEDTDDHKLSRIDGDEPDTTSSHEGEVGNVDDHELPQAQEGEPNAGVEGAEIPAEVLHDNQPAVGEEEGNELNAPLPLIASPTERRNSINEEEAGVPAEDLSVEPHEQTVSSEEAPKLESGTNSGEIDTTDEGNEREAKEERYKDTEEGLTVQSRDDPTPTPTASEERPSLEKVASQTLRSVMSRPPTSGDPLPGAEADARETSEPAETDQNVTSEVLSSQYASLPNGQSQSQETVPEEGTKVNTPEPTTRAITAEGPSSNIVPAGADEPFNLESTLGQSIETLNGGERPYSAVPSQLVENQNLAEEVVQSSENPSQELADQQQSSEGTTEQEYLDSGMRTGTMSSTVSLDMPMDVLRALEAQLDVLNAEKANLHAHLLQMEAERTVHIATITNLTNNNGQLSRDLSLALSEKQALFQEVQDLTKTLTYLQEKLSQIESRPPLPAKSAGAGAELRQQLRVAEERMAKLQKENDALRAQKLQLLDKALDLKMKLKTQSTDAAQQALGPRITVTGGKAPLLQRFKKLPDIGSAASDR
ncbi:hypothetical protein SpCBS45565_g03706 [Spizellomyces sp. 'palustris']|nr:hypothetical protein SpCBS45565_g03706 [Spizellomyces sp. 'palustris']